MASFSEILEQEMNSANLEKLQKSIQNIENMIKGNGDNPNSNDFKGLKGLTDNLNKEIKDLSDKKEEERKKREEALKTAQNAVKQISIQKSRGVGTTKILPKSNPINGNQANEKIAPYLKKKLGESTENKKNKKLNKPFRTPDGPKKFAVYVKNDKGNVVKVNFGDPDMEIKRDDDDRRKSFRARHGCDDPGPKWKARYWSCKFWEKDKIVTELT